MLDIFGHSISKYTEFKPKQKVLVTAPGFWFRKHGYVMSYDGKDLYSVSVKNTDSHASVLTFHRSEIVEIAQ